MKFFKVTLDITLIIQYANYCERKWYEADKHYKY